MTVKKAFTGQRINAGVGERYAEAMAGLDAPDQSVSTFVADWIFDAYDTRIRSQLGKMGLELPTDGPLTVDALKLLIEQRSGLDLAELSKDAVMNAIDKQFAKQLSERLGFEVSTVFNADIAKAEVKAEVLARLADGRGMSFLKGPALTRLRSLATFTRAGFTPDESRKALNRIYQKRYRRHNREVWD